MSTTDCIIAGQLIIYLIIVASFAARDIKLSKRIKFLEALVRKMKRAELIRGKVDRGEWLRAGGECICTKCGKEYSRHEIVEAFPWLNMLCDGTLVKL